jgi:hypothetical protein
MHGSHPSSNNQADEISDKPLISRLRRLTNRNMRSLRQQEIKKPKNPETPKPRTQKPKTQKPRTQNPEPRNPENPERIRITLKL